MADQKDNRGGAQKVEDSSSKERESVKATSPTSAPDVDGKVIDAGERPRRAAADVDGVKNRLKANEPMVVDEDVYEEFYPAGAKRTAHRLLFTKGQVVLKSTYDAALNRKGVTTTPYGEDARARREQRESVGVDEKDQKDDDKK